MNKPRPAVPRSESKFSVNRIPTRSISLAIAVSVVLYAGMAAFADWEAFGAAVSALPALLWVQVVMLSLLSYLLRFARWHYFIVALGFRIPIFLNLEIYLAAFALTLTPGKAGESVRSVYLHPYGVSYPHSIGAFLSERLLDLASVGGLASLVILTLPNQRLWLLVGIACIFSMALLSRAQLLTILTRSSIIAHAARTIATVRFLLSDRRLVVAAPLSLMAWVTQGISLYLVVHALGHELPVSTAITIYCLSILAGAASFIPGGLGTTEAAIVLLLSTAGVGQTDAITASLISRGLTLWLAIGIGITAMTTTALTHQPTH